MQIMFLLIIASLLVASGFLIAFLWAVKSGQFDDTQTPSMRMLMDDTRQQSTHHHKLEQKDQPN